MPRMFAPARSRTTSTPTRCPTRSSRASATAGPRQAADRPDADDHEHERPDERADGESLEDRVADAGVGAAASEDVASVDREPDRPDEDQRERQRRSSEADDVTRLPVGARPAKATGKGVDH